MATRVLHRMVFFEKLGKAPQQDIPCKLSLYLPCDSGGDVQLKVLMKDMEANRRYEITIAHRELCSGEPKMIKMKKQTNKQTFI